MKELNFKYQGCSLRKIDFFHMYLKGTLSGLRLFLATESPLKIVKNDCYFILNVFFFILRIVKFLSGLFSHVEKWLDWKGKVNLKLYDIRI